MPSTRHIPSCEGNPLPRLLQIHHNSRSAHNVVDIGDVQQAVRVQICHSRMAVPEARFRAPGQHFEIPVTWIVGNKFLRFRHVLRNTYGFVMQAERMRPLEERSGDVLGRFTHQIQAFNAWMLGEDAVQT